MSDEADTLDHLWTKPLSAAEVTLKGDLQRVHDELRELLMAFGESRTLGARTIRVGRVDEQRVYELYDLLTAIRVQHKLAER